MVKAKEAEDSHSWPRWLARASLMAAFLCFAMNCVLMQVTSKQQPQETQLASAIVGWSSLAVVIAGLVVGVVAGVYGWKSRDRDTLVIAALGAALNGGIVLVMLWLLYQIGRLTQ